MTDPFQEKLLTALKEDIASRDAVPAAPRSHRRRWLLGAGLATAALAGVTAVALPQVGGGAAYAVEREPDGSIKIALDKWALTPADIEGFENKLESYGVPAEVDWLDNGQGCAHPRGNEVGDPFTPPGPLWAVEPGEDGEDDFWRIRPEYLRPGQTLVWELQVIHLDGGTTLSNKITVVEGPVAPCVIVPGMEINIERADPGPGGPPAESPGSAAPSTGASTG
ncbi:hypothetical protein Afil01_51010 [Actinorhabdospora filicis]|uniref:Uncharacterized protein n=1 Tax=Actinorhabdospora filicis TaxID=1785913 RepID=A0A9W6SNT8_9ACTN|nr:hypothetical protein [Actinorhabdospora filicis]GLZ80294.1 hypothetical protein Afil01_51010 [Actinorhabdospora filicis]